ncbi:MAG TPA: RagB/SusD family nutrient uptake outer membrane protein [Bacteroidales bacterium]|jgi:hypothetical protein|nr:RagB/SusD family nutrient uptake outer membrane protein [Bacteroidales bacterium]
MKRILNITLFIAGIVLFTASCTKDLNTVPIDPDQITSAAVYEDPASYKMVLAKLYSGLSVTGQQGAAGNPDVEGIDEGFGEYLRAYWYHQELTTDEAVLGWNDQTIKDFHWQKWGTSDVFVAAMYYRIFAQISFCNEYIRETSDAKLDERGVTGTLRTDIGFYRAEARFLRALSYYHALDLFGSTPFVTENDGVGKFFPVQKSRAELFNYVESELLAIEPLLKDAKTNEYGRADKAAADFLLAKLYLNAEVYTGTAKYTECITYANKVINSGYILDPSYENIFKADNNNSPEIIFPVTFDGLRTRTWGGTTFIVHAAIGGSMPPADFGVAGGWGGIRTTSALIDKFAGSVSKRISPIPHPRKAAYPLLNCPGSYQGWDPAKETTVLASVNGDGRYEGYLYFADGGTQFKFAKGSWDHNWGDDGGDGTLEPNGANIQVADAGYYKVNVDTNTFTYTIMKTDWGVIGSATADGWNSDQNMTYVPNADNNQAGVWTATLSLTAGEIKFRANDGWDLNYGDNGNNGILDGGGDDIPIPEAGDYVITLKLGAPDYTYTIERLSIDGRAMFWTAGQTLEINDIASFTDGYAVTKWKNVTSTGAAGSDNTYVDTDFPMFRLADAYLMYAEAVLRGGSGGDAGTALTLVNALRTRAYGDTHGNIAASDLTLNFILDERARELYWECTRRTDLVRFGQFTNGDYVWPWKGYVKEGAATDAHYNIFPLPSSDVSANPNLTQNPGY